jgi:hypothetical protein
LVADADELPMNDAEQRSASNCFASSARSATFASKRRLSGVPNGIRRRAVPAVTGLESARHFFDVREMSESVGEWFVERFTRILGVYVREEKLMTLEEAIPR